MLNIRALMFIVVMLAGITLALGLSLGADHKDDYVYDQLVTIKGKVEILNHPTLGRTGSSYDSIVFQREDCKRCIVVARTDDKGNYELRVGRGKYKVIVLERAFREGEPSYDLLAPGQPRYVEATSVRQPNVFNLQLMLPPK